MDEGKTLADKMAGRMRFPDDAGGRKLLQGMVLGAPVSEGRPVSLELPAVPAGMVCVTPADIPGADSLQFGPSSLPVLAVGEILWTGQPLMAAAGTDPDEVEDWLSRVRIDISPLKSAGPPALKEILKQKGTPGRAFARAFQVIEDSFAVPGETLRNENEPVVCQRDGSQFIVHASTVWPSAVRRNVAAVLKVDRSRIRVKPYEVSAVNGRNLWISSWSSSLAALLCAQSRRAVRMLMPPAAAGEGGGETPGAEFHIRGAVDGEGHVLALEVDFTVSTGSIMILEEELLERIVLGLFGVYPCRNYIIRGRIERSRRPPAALGPAAGFELGVLAGELFASRVAENSLNPPGYWRRIAFPNPAQDIGPGLTQPKDNPMGELLNRALAVSDFERRSGSFEQTRLGRGHLNRLPEFSRGIGLSCAYFGNAFLTGSRELGSASVTLTLGKNGELTIDIPSASTGRALLKAWTALVGERLGIEGRQIQFSSEYASTADSGPLIWGQDVSVYTRLLEQAVADLAARRFRDPLPITVARSRRWGTRRTWNPENLEGNAFDTLSWGVGVVEVSVSSRTLVARTDRVWLFIDGGLLLAPEHARASVESSVEQALRWCTGAGHGCRNALMEIQFHEPALRRNSRDVSTLPWLLVPSAFVQAVRQATGARVDRLPVTPDQLSRGGA